LRKFLMNKIAGWLLFFVLSFIWGSSFILMKYGMQTLSPYQVAALRILSAGIVLLPFAFKAWRSIPKNLYPRVFMSAFIGSFIPAFLFCIAETRITSTLAGILNALTPLFTIILGSLIYKTKISGKKTVGVLIGFLGLSLLPFAASKTIGLQNLSYTLFILIATIMYGYNVNMVSQKLKHIPSIQIASLAFAFLIPPCIIILLLTGYFSNSEAMISVSTLASSVLGIGGTAVATVLFYRLIKLSGTVLASLVTYGIPFVAIFWGILAGETISPLEIGCLLIILSGVYLVNKKEKKSV
jgi:drug/metabolite transporter (DMT)-like permease